jgi:thioredoxin-dependent peroxiredoxin
VKPFILAAQRLLRALFTVGVISAAIVNIEGPQSGERFPNALAAPDQSGKPQTLTSAMGELGVAVFFVSADCCPLCMGQLIDANHHLSRFRHLGLAVVSVSIDDVEKIAAFARAQNIDYTILLHPYGETNQALAIRDDKYPVGSAALGVSKPTLYVIDCQGVIRLRYQEPTYKTRPNLNQILLDAEAAGL